MVIANKTSVCAAAVAVILRTSPCSSFQIPAPLTGQNRILFASATEEAEIPPPAPELSLDPEASRLKDDLVSLAAATRRGFSASRTDRDKAKRIINNLAKYSPSDEPAAAYYQDGREKTSRKTIAGKWTLIYTDAPDITSLDAGPFSTAKLGRIGQECDPPTIKNVIEWQRPDWASSLPFSGGDSSRVLQKVVCEGSATKEDPKMVDLKLLGFELSGVNGDDSAVSEFFNGPAALFESNPVKLQGPLAAPFGKFDILYLDEEMRITKTYQGYFAVNVRDGNEWF